MKAKTRIINYDKNEISEAQVGFAEAAGDAFLARFPPRLIELILKDGDELYDLGSDVIQYHAEDWLYDEVRNSMHPVIGDVIVGLEIYLVGE